MSIFLCFGTKFESKELLDTTLNLMKPTRACHSRSIPFLPPINRISCVAMALTLILEGHRHRRSLHVHHVIPLFSLAVAVALLTLKIGMWWRWIGWAIQLCCVSCRGLNRVLPIGRVVVMEEIRSRNCKRWRINCWGSRGR